MLDPGVATGLTVASAAAIDPEKATASTNRDPAVARMMKDCLLCDLCS